jgi:iron complex transport system permease protein
LFLILLAAMATALSRGAVATAPREAMDSLLYHWGLIANPPASDGVLWAIRIPRVVVGSLIGAVLAASGVALQGLYRTNLADSQLLGLGPGAAIGGVLGTAAGGIQGGVAGGAVAGLLTAFVVRRLGRAGDGDPTRFVLSGVALGAALSAWVGFFVFGLDRSAVPSVDFWLLGSLTGSTWRAAGTLAALGAAASVGFIASRRSLDLLALGDGDARAMGVDVDLVRTALLMAVGVASGAAVGAAGVVGFVGLLVPALVRPLVGPAHGPLYLGSSLAGAALVVVADTAARTVVSPIEIPVGLVTAAVGGPVLIWMISRTRGWT